MRIFYYWLLVSAGSLPLGYFATFIPSRIIDYYYPDRLEGYLRVFLVVNPFLSLLAALPSFWVLTKFLSYPKSLTILPVLLISFLTIVSLVFMYI